VKGLGGELVAVCGGRKHGGGCGAAFAGEEATGIGVSKLPWL